MHSKRQVLNPEEELELVPRNHLVVEMFLGHVYGHL